jgi:hypothetical protein
MVIKKVILRRMGNRKIPMIGGKEAYGGKDESSQLTFSKYYRVSNK